jgi:hypothetical protein
VGTSKKEIDEEKRRAAIAGGEDERLRGGEGERRRANQR